jgi:hypothetical protein
MSDAQKKKARHRRLKALRVRKRLLGTAERPRLSVARSLKNISSTPWRRCPPSTRRSGIPSRA